MKYASDILQQSLKLSLEDSNPQVEINFNVDTDKEGAPDTTPISDDSKVDDAPTTDPSTEEPSNENTDAEDKTDEAGDEVGKTESEVDELNEAQNSLESLKYSLNKHIQNGTLDKVAMEDFYLGMQAVTHGRFVKPNVTSLESMNQSVLFDANVALEHLDISMEKIGGLSLDAVKQWIGKLSDSIGMVVKAEDTLVKRAKGYLEIARASAGQHDSNDRISVNSKRGIKMRYLNTLSWKDEDEFLEHFNKFAGIYENLKTASGQRGHEDNLISEIFGQIDGFKESHGHQVLETFGGHLVRGNEISFIPKKGSDDDITVPTLTPSMAVKVVHQTLSILSKTPVINDSITKLSNGVKNTQNNDGTVVLSKSIKESLSTLNKLNNLKVKVLSEVLSYVNMSLTDRDLNNGTEGSDHDYH